VCSGGKLWNITHLEIVLSLQKKERRSAATLEKLRRHVIPPLKALKKNNEQ
jgi:hypothetical protein